MRVDGDAVIFPFGESFTVVVEVLEPCVEVVVTLEVDLAAKFQAVVEGPLRVLPGRLSVSILKLLIN